MQQLNKDNQDIALFFNKKHTGGNSSVSSYNYTVHIKNKSKPKKKLKIINRNEPTKNTNNINPSDFDNEYHYFIKICSFLKLPYYKYNTTLWCGPAIIIHLFENYNNKIRNLFKIDTEIDILSNYQTKKAPTTIAIHPSKNIIDRSIPYKNIYKQDMGQKELVEIYCRNKLFRVDKQTYNMLESLNTLEREYVIQNKFNKKIEL